MADKGFIETSADRYMPRSMRPYWERLRNSSIGYRLAHGAFWSTMGAGFSQSLMLVTSIIAARLLGREQFGQYGMVISTVGMFSIFAGFGLGTTATKFVAQFKYSDPQRAGRIIAMSSLVALGTGVVATAALLIAAPMLAAKTLAAPSLAGMLRLACGIIFFGAVNSSQIGALAGFEAFRVIARTNLFSGILTFAFTTTGTLLWGLPGALVGQAAALGGGCLVAAWALRKEAVRYGIGLTYAGCTAEWGVLVRFSLPAVLSGLMVSPVTWICSALLVNQPQGYAEMGIFNAANSWQKAILFLPGCVGAIALPMLANLHGENDVRRYFQALKYNVALNAALAFIAAGAVSVCSPYIMQAYGKNFTAGSVVLIFLSISAALSAVASVVGNAIASIGKMWWGYLLNLLWGLALLLLFWALRGYGAKGLAMAYCGSYLVHTFNSVLFSYFVLVKQFSGVDSEKGTT